MRNNRKRLKSYTHLKNLLNFSLVAADYKTLNFFTCSLLLWKQLTEKCCLVMHITSYPIGDQAELLNTWELSVDKVLPKIFGGIWVRMCVFILLLEKGSKQCVALESKTPLGLEEPRGPFSYQPFLFSPSRFMPRLSYCWEAPRGNTWAV